MKAMILAAGKGTRLKPLTDKKPKALLEVYGIPLLKHQILYLRHYGFHEFIVNVHHLAEQVIDYINNLDINDVHIECSHETELLDTGGGLYKARGFFDEGKPFLLTASDVITDLDLSDLYKSHLSHKSIVTLAVRQRKSTRELLFDNKYCLCGWQNNITNEVFMAREVQDPVKIAFSAMHVIDPFFFSLITERGAFSLIDVYLRLASEWEIRGYEHSRSHWFEFGRIDKLQLQKNERIIRRIYGKYHV
ncbi:MAG: NTP transferase domain-containing protein [Bacteroidales bacterium]|nr:NTP transferase domain-containing protein [Bacteroidales bacterium]